MNAGGAPPIARVGATLGRYVLEGVLGHGAMATVFRARDTKLGRPVAVKVMNLAVAARSEAAERFRREAQAVAALKHPGIVEIHDFVPAADGEPAYIVAELIDGPTLRALLDDRRGRLLPEIAAVIGAELAEALALAHERGVVHRDLKPDNVMLERAASGSRVVLTDFGVAQVTGLETMTATGALIGSPAYMSPEQARGADIGPAADVWALGVLLYEMATGCVPFPGKDPFVVVSAILRGTFRKPSQVTALVGPAYEAAVLRCLTTAPGDRHASARALADELRAIAADGGLTDARVALRRLLDEPDALERETRARVADAAVEHARRHARRGELARAFREISRAAAYVPKHAGAEALLARLQRRQRWVRSAAGIAAVAAVAGAAWGVRGYVARQAAMGPAEKVPVVEVSERKSEAAVMAMPAPAAQRPPPVEPATSPPRPTPKRGRARRDAAAMLTVGAKAAPVVETPPPAVVEEEPPKTPEQKEPAEVAGVRVRLRASNGICDPSLDHHPSVHQRSVATYDAVTPGRHEVHCTMDGKKHPIGTIDVEPGKPVEKVIKFDGQRFSLR